MQLTIVNAVPLISASAFWATKVENKGESAITTIPQKSKKPINKTEEDKPNTKGESRQQIPEHNSAIKAVHLAPKSIEI